MKKSFLSVNAAPTAIRQVDARVKITLLFVVSLLVVVIDSATTLGCLFTMAALLHIAARTEASKLKLLFLVLGIALWGTVLSQAIFFAGFPRTSLVVIIPGDFGFLGRVTGGVHLYREGFVYGLRQGLRFLCMTTMGLLMVWTTEPREILIGLLRLRIPYTPSFMLITAMRFIPILISEVEVILMALRIKGFRVLRTGILHPVRGAACVLNPLLANLIRKSNSLALSVECRGFAPAAGGSGLEPKPLLAAEKCLMLGFALGLFSVVALKVLYLLYFHSIFYASALRPLYAITKLML